MTMKPLPDSAIGVRMGGIDISPVLNDQDKDYFQYHPTSVMEQAQIANRPCLLYTSPSPRDRQKSRMPSSA